MTDQQLRDELMTLLIAGHETVASGLAWTWHLLATHPEAEAKLHAELAGVLGGRTPRADDLPDLRYTRQFLMRRCGCIRRPGSSRARRWPTTRSAAIAFRPVRWSSPAPTSPTGRRLCGRTRKRSTRSVSPRSARGSAALRLLPVRRRAQAVHRRAVRHRRGAVGYRHGRSALPAAARARPPGRGGAGRDAAAETRADDADRAARLRKIIAV